MWVFFAIYLSTGIIALLYTTLKNDQNGENVGGAIFAIASDPLIALIRLLFWPLLFLHEIKRKSQLTKERDQKLDLEAQKLEKSKRSEELTGQAGVTISMLRPFGLIKLRGKRIEAKSDSAIIPSGTRIVVTGHESGVPVVSPVKS